MQMKEHISIKIFTMNYFGNKLFHSIYLTVSSSYESSQELTLYEFVNKVRQVVAV